MFVFANRNVGAAFGSPYKFNIIRTPKGRPYKVNGLNRISEL